MKYHVASTLRTPLAILMATFVLLTPPAFASQFTVLHNFHAHPAAYPASQLIAGPDRSLYGTTAVQGEGIGCPPKLCGTVFRFTHTSRGWRYHVIHKFRGPQSDGEEPFGQLVFDKTGNLYGTTFSQGSSNCTAQRADCGTVFQLSRTAKGWSETVLYRFTGGADGAFPDGNLLFDAAGNLYGTALGGGSFNGSLCNTLGCGVVFELSPGSSGWTETVLYTFTGMSDGVEPDSLAFDANGNLLGVADFGGTINNNCPAGCGTVFKLTPGVSGWTQSILYSFSGGSDGAYPVSQLIFDPMGNLYGTALGGGLVACGGYPCGTVFELSPDGNQWTFSDLYSFSGSDGQNPHGILFDPTGNIFGVAYGGVADCPADGCGVLFKLVPGSSNWTETVLFKFNGTSNGEFPNAVMMDGAGNLFGTADAGGADNLGTLFEFTP